jgi:hypothetical protein
MKTFLYILFLVSLVTGLTLLFLLVLGFDKLEAFFMVFGTIGVLAGIVGHFRNPGKYYKYPIGRNFPWM